MEVRLRSASNILFKLQHEIFDADVLALTSCVTILLNNIHGCMEQLLQESTTEVVDSSKEQNVLFNSLLSIITMIGSHSHSSMAMDGYSKVLEKLYHFSTLDGIDGNSQSNLQMVKH